jgi:CO/xanthine dehydrogenase FAD-binding subunit
MAEASKLVENDISPITDVRAPAEYRLHMAKLLIKELLVEAYRRAFKGGFE